LRSPTDTSLQSPVRVSNGRFLNTACDTLVDKPFSDHHYESPISRLDAVAQVAVVIGIICTTVMGIGTCNGDFLMSALSLLLCLAFQAVQATLGDLHKHILKQVPLTIEGALTQLNIKCKTVSCAVCTCHCTYLPTYSEGSSIPMYPSYCTHCPRPEDLCGEPLLRGELNHKAEPKNIFHYHDFNDYLDHLLSCSDIEALMDHLCDELATALSSPKPQFIKNVFEAQFFRNFAGPELGKLFIDRGDEGRYAFTLHVDFFNPEGMSLRGVRTSSGIISMTSLNLPVDIRYKPENMYLAGIIPGPKQPSLENLNHYIRLLMKDLAISWECSVWYSRTANYPNRRVTRSAIALAVCDLPAACHLAAFAGVGSHFFCSACSCYHKSNYGRVDFNNWVPRDKNILCQYAEEWRECQHLLIMRGYSRSMVYVTLSCGACHTGILVGSLSSTQCTASLRASSNIMYAISSALPTKNQPHQWAPWMHSTIHSLLSIPRLLKHYPCQQRRVHRFLRSKNYL